jgi:CBS domain-containing protein
MIATEIMSTPVIDVAPETPVSDVAALLAAHRISGVPVLERGRLVGIVNEMDLLHRHEIGTEQFAAAGPWWARLFRAEPGPSHYVKSHAKTARDVMTRAVDAVADDAPLSEIAALFDSRAVRRVCVVQQGKLIGVITRADIVRAVATEARRPRAERARDDEVIRTELLAELARQWWWRPEWSIVTVNDGVVQFSGVFDAADERASARVAAENVPGVRAVEDRRLRFADLPRSL